MRGLTLLHGMLAGPGDQMIVGGSIEGGWGWLPLYVVVGLLLSGLVWSGGLVAWLLAKRWEAVVLGACAFAGAAWWLRVRFHIAGEVTPLAGWLASALVGAALRGDSWARSRGVGRARRWPAFGTALIAFAVVLACFGAVRSGVASQQTVKATTYTRHSAEQLGQLLADSDARTANDLALVAVGPDKQVVRVSGDRRREGAELVVKITWHQYGLDPLTRCWRYSLSGEPDDARPTAVKCPTSRTR